MHNFFSHLDKFLIDYAEFLTETAETDGWDWDFFLKRRILPRYKG